MKRGAVILVLALGALTLGAWTESDCKKQPTHPDCVKFQSPTPSPSPTKTAAPTLPPRIPPTRPPFTVAPSATPKATLIPPATTTPQPLIRLPSTSTQ